MRISFTFKTPNVVEDAVVRALEDTVSKEVLDGEDGEFEAQVAALKEKLNTKFFKYGEYVTVEVDTVTMKATVQEN